MSFFYYILILAYILIPLILILKKKDELLTYWIVQGIFLDILSVQFYGNISSFKLSGLILFPFIIKDFSKYCLTSKAGRYIGLFIFLTIITFLTFSFILPPESPLGLKDLFKGVKQILTLTSEVSVAMYLAKRLHRNELNVYKSVLYSTCISVFGIFLEKLSNVDLFHYFTNSKKLFIEHRKRGFAFEPRAASQHMTYILFGVLINNNFSIIKKVVLFLIVSIAFYYALAMTGIVLLILGVFILLSVDFFYNKRSLKRFFSYLVAASLSFLILINWGPKNIVDRVKSRSYILNGKDLVAKFEPAESTVVNYFKHNPQRILFGIGTGLMPSISKKYTPKKWSEAWPEGVRYLPFMGLILILSNVGIVGLTLLLLFYLHAAIRVWKNESISYNYVFFTTALLYFFQVRYFHVFALAIAFLEYYRIQSQSTSE